MSTNPPPPPPFGSAPGPYRAPAGYDRQTLKAQRRAIAEQGRQQRAQMRLQMRAARRNSVVGPLLLVMLGTMLLLLQTGRLHWPDALTWLGHWWPAVLIVAGLIMVAEWALDRGRVSPDGISLGPRRSLGGGAVTLLILLAVVGASVMAAENGSAWARRNFDRQLGKNGFGDWRHAFGIGTEITEDLNTSIENGGALTVENPHGDVTVTGSSQDGQVHVTVHRHIYVWEQDEAENRRRAEQVRFSGDRTHVILTAPSQDEDHADLTIELPHDASVTVHSGHGDVTLGELRGAVDVSAADGDVKLTALSGPVHLQTKDDNADITAHSLGSGLALDGRTGDINLSDVDGAVSLHGDFFGTTHLERIRGPVHFQSSFTEFVCAGLPGDLNVEGRSDLDVHRVEGPVTLSTTNRNLTLNGVRGGITVTDRNGSVNLTLAGPPAPGTVTNENGSVEVSVPASQGYSVKARTQNGDIQNDFGIVPRKTGQTSEMTGNAGPGGPTLHLQTTEGDIRVRRSTAADDKGWEATPTRITPSPPDQEKSSKRSTDTSR